MSTTIERALRAGAAAAAVLGGWALVMLALPFLGASGRPVAVVGDPAAVLAAIRTAGGAVVEVRGGVVLARSDRPGFAAGLYRAGAPLVLEARIAAGCGGARSGA